VPLWLLVSRATVELLYKLTDRSSGLFQQPNHSYRFPRHRFHTFPSPRAAHFDTHLFVQRLEHNGMTRPQAEGVIRVLSEVIEESVRTMELGLISKEDVEKVGQSNYTTL